MRINWNKKISLPTDKLNDVKGRDGYESAILFDYHDHNLASLKFTSKKADFPSISINL